MLSILILAFAAAASAGSVVTLSSNNFAEIVKSDTEKGWMVKFYAPWCGHCKKLAPTWNELASSAQGFGVGSMDCTTSQATCTEYKIKGYPTIKFVKDNKMYSYKGSRSIDALTEFATTSYATAETNDL